MPAKSTTAAAEVVEHASLAAALAAFQGDMPTVNKGKTARVPMKAGGSYTYKYADLADVVKAAHPNMSRHGLSFTARPEHRDGLGLVLVGILRHTSGESDEGLLPIQGRTAQEIGSSLTYNRRYLLGCMTGVVTDEDEDGSLAAAAGSSRPEFESHAEPPAQRQGGTRQNGRTAPPADPAQGDDGPATGGADPAVVKAQTIAATRAQDEGALRAVWDDACQSGAVHASIVDPDADDKDAPRITLGAFITRRKGDLAAQGVPA